MNKHKYKEIQKCISEVRCNVKAPQGCHTGAKVAVLSHHFPLDKQQTHLVEV